MLEHPESVININCMDPLARTAMLMAIDNENMEMLELLLENKAETKDALLHAINEEYVEAVEVLLDHEEMIHVEGEPWSWETLSEEEAVFATDMTPLGKPSFKIDITISDFTLNLRGEGILEYDFSIFLFKRLQKIIISNVV